MTRALTEKLDPELPVVEAIAAGDREAFTDFVCRQGKWVRGVIYGVLGDPDRVDDVAQHVWSLVWQQAATCRRSRRSFCCWIRAVAFLGGTNPAATLALATISGCCSHDPGPTQLGGRSC